MGKLVVGLRHFLPLYALVLAFPAIVAAQSSSFTITVDSTRGWQTTLLKVTKGQQLSFSAVGSWTVDFRIPNSYVGPDGYSPQVDSTIFQGCKLDASLLYGKLLARVGDSPSAAIGSKGAFTADRDGVLAFRIHDGDACLLDNAGSVSVIATGTGLTTATPPLPIFYCITGPGKGAGCIDVYKNSESTPGDELSKTVELLNSPRVSACVVSVLDGLASLAQKPGAEKIPGFQQGLVVLWLAARLANVPGFFEDYFNLIIRLEKSGNTPQDLAFWLDWTRGVVEILVKNRVDDATFKDCRTLWTDPPKAR